MPWIVIGLLICHVTNLSILFLPYFYKEDGFYMYLGI
jgi:hypothetical protein